MRSMLPKPRVLLFSLTFFSTLSGCAMTTGSAVTDGRASFCEVASPLYWSKDDTAATVAQVKEYNAVGKTLCGWGK